MRHNKIIDKCGLVHCMRLVNYIYDKCVCILNIKQTGIS